MILNHWGATDAEINSPVVGDDLCLDAREIATRCITCNASPDVVFAWIRQMGFGKAGWYSYDWIDNLGRRSASIIDHEWQNVHSGDIVPGGPIDFEAVIVDAPRAFVLRVGRKGVMGSRLCFSLAYELRDDPAGCRLVTRMRARINVPGGRFLEHFILGPGDGIMLRKQLLNIARRC